MKYYIGIDLGGSAIKYALLDETGNISIQGKRITPDSIEGFYNEVESIYLELKDKAVIEGVAMSMPGAVDSDSGFIQGSSATPYIHGPNIKKDLEERLHVRVEIENDANCAALAEVWIGSAKDVQDCVFIVSGSGIGGAIVKDKKIIKGKHLHGGELGYMITSNDIENEEFDTWSADGSTVNCIKAIAKELGVDYKTLDGKEIFDNKDNNPIYSKYVNKFYFVLAMGIFNLQYVTDPEMIVIGGGISSRDDLLEQVEKRLDILFNRFTHAYIRPVVVRCQYANDANIIGATYHFINKENLLNS